MLRKLRAIIKLILSDEYALFTHSYGFKSEDFIGADEREYYMSCDYDFFLEEIRKTIDDIEKDKYLKNQLKNG